MGIATVVVGLGLVVADLVGLVAGPGGLLLWGGLGALAAGGFAIFEARAGWCVVRWRKGRWWTWNRTRRTGRRCLLEEGGGGFLQVFGQGQGEVLKALNNKDNLENTPRKCRF